MKPVFQVREYKGRWSVVARIFNPDKEIYEHPLLIGLKKETAERYCEEHSNKDIDINYIIKNWIFIGN